MLRLFLVAFLATCGGARPNRMLGTPVRLASLRPPHEAIYIKTFRGVVRVYLDTGDTEVIARGRNAVAIDDDTSVEIRRKRFVVRRGTDEREVPDLVATTEPPVVSPDGTRFVVTQILDGPEIEDSSDLAVVTLADLSVQRFHVAKIASSLAWSPDGSEVRFDMWDQRLGSETFRIVVATGEIAKVARETVDAERERERERATPGENACVARDQQLGSGNEGDHQRIVILPLAASTDPDRIASTKPRVLVEATDYQWHPHSGGEPAARFGGAIFSSSCDHFVFELDGRIYVGDVATGRFAFLAIGSNPARTPPRN